MFCYRNRTDVPVREIDALIQSNINTITNAIYIHYTLDISIAIEVEWFSVIIFR